MERQVIASPSRDLAILSRLRLQLAVLWLVAVLLPGAYVYAGFITAESYQAIFNSVVAATLACFVGLISLRRVNAFPGVRSYAFILPSLAVAYGVALVLIFGLRLAYSRSVLTASFVLAVLTTFALIYVADRWTKLLLFIVPGGDAISLKEVSGVDCKIMNNSTLPESNTSIIVADFRHSHDGEWERVLARAAIRGMWVYHSKLIMESLTGKVNIEHLSENNFGSLLPNMAYSKFKRISDIILCIISIPLLFIPMAAMAILIKLDSDGPVIFRQSRVGYRGETFEMFKFRTMRPREVAADENARIQDAMTKSDDDRITRIGRFLRRTRLDELPQILNILRGEMSWIGPRPEAVPLSKWYEQEIPFYSYRHIIRPGISGWAQVHQGHVTDLDSINEKLAYDFYYVKYFSAWLDIVIALRTIPTMIGGFGAR
ncbi:Sugar transferase involved in LPS biosynthesis (colanic, teichoic acid) [Sphingomonas laterariae]|uniref:Sugar transferase involved in LPS biosynthesis (Colanic, teichoic acid) n=1 Tax=Edaphosphingomonas laterariae TaxID=861865 RepID=A0A239JX39_9SPHN|nr:sugar transferase [Sphingomonas laterariae]SNT10239.1 Sugar transferase involved in LPS biosynthesis (colanic, teichoic acid) [Sphingomonas laterariae]